MKYTRNPLFDKIFPFILKIEKRPRRRNEEMPIYACVSNAS